MSRAGQVGVIVKNPGWYGWIVQKVTGSPAFHTITAIDDFTAVEATVPYVRYVKIADYGDSIIWTDIPLTYQQEHDVVSFVKSQVGRRYAYFDIFLLLIAHVTKRATPDPILEHLQNHLQWYCAELCDAGMNAAGINMFPGRPECTVIPDDFYRWVMSEERTT